MAKTYTVWLVVEEYDSDTDKHTQLSESVDAGDDFIEPIDLHCTDTVEQARAFVTTIDKHFTLGRERHG